VLFALDPAMRARPIAIMAKCMSGLCARPDLERHAARDYMA